MLPVWVLREVIQVTRYEQGRALEYRVRDLLVALGFFVVRSAGSKTPVDLVALPIAGKAPEWALSRPVLAQAKRGGVLGPAEWNELLGAAESVGAVAVLARYIPRRPIELFRLDAPKVGRGRQPMTRLDLGLEVDAMQAGSETGGN